MLDRDAFAVPDGVNIRADDDSSVRVAVFRPRPAFERTIGGGPHFDRPAENVVFGNCRDLVVYVRRRRDQSRIEVVNGRRSPRDTCAESGHGLRRIEVGKASDRPVGEFCNVAVCVRRGFDVSSRRVCCKRVEPATVYDRIVKLKT